MFVIVDLLYLILKSQLLVFGKYPLSLGSQCSPPRTHMWLKLSMLSISLIKKAISLQTSGKPHNFKIRVINSLQPSASSKSLLSCQPLTLVCKNPIAIFLKMLFTTQFRQRCKQIYEINYGTSESTELTPSSRFHQVPI